MRQDPHTMLAIPGGEDSDVPGLRRGEERQRRPVGDDRRMTGGADLCSERYPTRSLAPVSRIRDTEWSIRSTRLASPSRKLAGMGKKYGSGCPTMSIALPRRAHPRLRDSTAHPASRPSKNRRRINTSTRIHTRSATPSRIFLRGLLLGRGDGGPSGSEAHVALKPPVTPPELRPLGSGLQLRRLHSTRWQCARWGAGGMGCERRGPGASGPPPRLPRDKSTCCLV